MPHPILAELSRPHQQLGPYRARDVDKIMEISKTLGFEIGMSGYELGLFIKSTAKGEIYITPYKNARVCTDITWVDEHGNNNVGWLSHMNETKGCTRFCWADETPKPPSSTENNKYRGGPLPARWKKRAITTTTAFASLPGKILRRPKLDPSQPIVINVSGVHAYDLPGRRRRADLGSLSLAVIEAQERRGDGPFERRLELCPDIRRLKRLERRKHVQAQIETVIGLVVPGVGLDAHEHGEPIDGPRDALRHLGRGVRRL